MNHSLNLRALMDKMKKPPKRNQFYNYFLGLPDSLTAEEIKDLKKTIVAENKKVLSFIGKTETKLKSAKQ